MKTPLQLQQHLSTQLNRRVKLQLHRNRRTFLSTRENPGGSMLIRLHRAFLEAQEAHLGALVSFLKGGGALQRNIMLAFLEQWHAQQPNTTNKEREWSKGSVYELRPRADELNRLYFDDALTFTVSWNRHVRRTKHYPRTLHLGLCSTVNKEILIHPLLDQPGVPDFFVDYILFHEMTHLEVVPRANESGRMIAHSKEFYAKETQFPRYKEAVAFQEQKLSDFIKSWWIGKPHPRWASAKKVVETRKLPHTLKANSLPPEATTPHTAKKLPQAEQLSLFSLPGKRDS
ncbi:MAG: hypothetical protein ACFCU1_11105 [Sumerlaeia bacterium]